MFDALFLGVCVRSHHREIEGCKLADEDVDDLLSCLDDLGRENILEL